MRTPWQWWAWLLCLQMLACGNVPAGTPAAPPATRTLLHAEAARGGWNDEAPPAHGWVPVELMDVWTGRWPDHDGVVWYRVRWRQDDATRPAGLLVNYLCMAGAVYVNGSLVARDRQLVEPLSRAWVAPKYFLLSPPLLREGENTLLVRVSGLAAYQPGFGTVTVGEPAAVRAEFEREHFRRFDIKLVNLAMAAVLGALFLLIWLLRRQDSVFGWFALTELSGSLYGANFLVSGPWPFPTTDGWQAFIAAMYVCTGACYAMFLLRYSERRFPRLERAMGATCAAALLAALLAPGWMGPGRTPWIMAGALFFYAAIGFFLVRAWRLRRVDTTVLALCVVAPVLVSFHDFALFMGWVRGDTYLLGLTSVFTLAGIGFVLAHRFVGAMRRVEGFNAELEGKVRQATGELAESLNRQHALELAHGRAGERLQLVRDLHDGFGGTLVGTIARLQQAPADMPREAVVDLLREMRDDLRLVIDSTAREHDDLAALIAPLRHRNTRLLEAADIDARWRLHGLDGVELGSARSLDLLRLLQEALTNAFRHSRARGVDVTVECDGGRIRLEVRDDGAGLGSAGPAAAEGGAGLASMRQRAMRLGGRLRIDSDRDGTTVGLEFPLAA
ncbi:sensor histidine kinase [Luteimonas suaedae]|uniref:sensor histidine kinase n=1 Tax=Luteimonas suaedae TaxID=2605430 RepID=UPI0011F00DD6|nr:ATP-binding protein [Luteimonas suaedae]